MKIIYLAHQISGNVEENLSDIRRIVRGINLSCTDVVPFVPYYCDCVAMEDDDPIQRGRGIANDEAILRSGMVNQVWLTGDRISSGMKAEVALANELGIPVIDYIGEL